MRETVRTLLDPPGNPNGGDRRSQEFQGNNVTLIPPPRRARQLTRVHRPSPQARPPRPGRAGDRWRAEEAQRTPLSDFIATFAGLDEEA